jgi:hypothetical protein
MSEPVGQGIVRLGRHKHTDNPLREMPAIAAHSALPLDCPECGDPSPNGGRCFRCRGESML